MALPAHGRAPHHRHGRPVEPGLPGVESRGDPVGEGKPVRQPRGRAHDAGEDVGDGVAGEGAEVRGPEDGVGVRLDLRRDVERPAGGDEDDELRAGVLPAHQLDQPALDEGQPRLRQRRRLTAPRVRLAEEEHDMRRVAGERGGGGRFAQLFAHGPAVPALDFVVDATGVGRVRPVPADPGERRRDPLEMVVGMARVGAEPVLGVLVRERPEHAETRRAGRGRDRQHGRVRPGRPQQDHRGLRQIAVGGGGAGEELLLPVGGGAEVGVVEHADALLAGQHLGRPHAELLLAEASLLARARAGSGGRAASRGRYGRRLRGRRAAPPPSGSPRSRSRRRARRCRRSRTR